jgi:predicted hotdog family 3-hydroxylacyl-ACP dehydratase
MLKDRAWIAAHIPHEGVMCLLDGVLDWDASGIRCLSRAHRSPQNPLRAHGRLAAVCGIEFAAQAMAVHGALTSSDPAPLQAGYLVSVRGVALHTARLDDVDADLLVFAARLGGDASGALYEFSLAAGSHADARPLVRGRAAIFVGSSAIVTRRAPV